MSNCDVAIPEVSEKKQPSRYSSFQSSLPQFSVLHVKMTSINIGHFNRLCDLLTLIRSNAFNLFLLTPIKLQRLTEWYLIGTILVILAVPVRITTMDVRLWIKTVESASTKRVPRVAGPHSKLFHTVSHFGVLRSEVGATLSLRSVGEPPQRLLAQNVARSTAEVTLHEHASSCRLKAV